MKGLLDWFMAWTIKRYDLDYLSCHYSRWISFYCAQNLALLVFWGMEFVARDRC
jgi:hypothetical protein